MAILLAGSKVWNAANWVSRAFFRDASEVVGDQSPLAERIRVCVDAQLDTLDLETASRAELDEMRGLLEKVIALNVRRNGANFAVPSMFPTYQQKLGELRELLATT